MQSVNADTKYGDAQLRNLQSNQNIEPTNSSDTFTTESIASSVGYYVTIKLEV